MLARYSPSRCWLQGGGKASTDRGGNPAVWDAVSAGKSQVMAWA